MFQTDLTQMTTDKSPIMSTEEYRLSFGTGGLYVMESAQLIQSFSDLGDWSGVIEDAVEKNLLQFTSAQSTKPTTLSYKRSALLAVVSTF